VLVLHGYIWFRMVRSTTRPGRVRRRLTWLVVALGALIVAAVPLGARLSLDAAAPLEWAAFSWLGIAFYLFLTLLALEPVRFVLRRRFRDAASPTTVGGDVQVVASGARRDAPAHVESGTAPEPGWAPGRGAVPGRPRPEARREPASGEEDGVLNGCATRR
jgi:uncharacterized protein